MLYVIVPDYIMMWYIRRSNSIPYSSFCNWMAIRQWCCSSSSTSSDTRITYTTW